jgi:FlaA1/EpsC-like NDP-sugar epimerase
MTIAEAVCLILQAAAQGRGGETFVFDMGEPLNIYEMARALSLFSGLAPGKDMPIEFVGLKEGEKITEELWEPWEKPKPTAHNRIFALSSAAKHPRGILQRIEELERSLGQADYDGVLACLHNAFPDFAVHRGDHAARPEFRQGERSNERAAVLS